MSISHVETPPKANTPASKQRLAAKNSGGTPRKSLPRLVAKQTTRVAEAKAVVTKQERVLAMLTGSKGASIDEIIKVTGWQPHSVRGFLAGTVKKKLGLTLTSSKPEGAVRRYRVAAGRGR